MNPRLVFRKEAKKINKAHILLILSLTALYNVALQMEDPNLAFEVSKLMIWVMNNHFHSGSFAFIVAQIEKHNRKFCGKLMEEKKEFMDVLNVCGSRYFPEMGLVHEELSSDEDRAQRLKGDIIGKAFECIQKRTPFLKKETKEVRLDRFEEEDSSDQEEKARMRQQRTDIRSMMQQGVKPKSQSTFPVLSYLFEGQNNSLHSRVQSQRSKSKTAKNSTTTRTPFLSNRQNGGETSIISSDNTGGLNAHQSENKSREMYSLELSAEDSVEEEGTVNTPYIGIENYSIDVDPNQKSIKRPTARARDDPNSTDMYKHESIVQSALGPSQKPMERCLAGLVLSSLRQHRCVPIGKYFEP
jgi:hypothetical protein